MQMGRKCVGVNIFIVKDFISLPNMSMNDYNGPRYHKWAKIF